MALKNTGEIENSLVIENFQATKKELNRQTERIIGARD